MTKEDKQRVIGKVVAINSDRFSVELLSGLDNFNVSGFDDIHYCFGDYPVGSPSWSIWHYVVKLTIGNETRNYAVCPMGSTGNIEEIKMIDFSDLSNMRKFG